MRQTRVFVFDPDQCAFTQQLKLKAMRPLCKTIGAVGVVALTFAVVVGFNTSGWAQGLDEGKTEFLSSCAPCHGTDGKGKGPVSAALKATPPDLTVLAKKNNGLLPVAAVYEMIDGRKSVSAHGTGEMPIWGYRYTASVRINVAPTVGPAVAPTNRILSRNVEFIVRSRILALVDYLNRIQEK